MNTHLQEQRNILNSKPFRRLADKTQVIPSINRDAQIRTRLTHSLEVASIAQEITYNLKRIVSYELNPTVTYNVSLLHDIAMAPLGHLGENTLNDVVKKQYGLHFEANAQNISLIEDKLQGITPLTIVSTIKYPFLIKENEKGKGLYEGQYNKYFPILQETITIQNQIPEIERNRTYECDIMEISDDLAYLFSDLEDYISLTKPEERITKTELNKLFKDFELSNPNLFFLLNEAIQNGDSEKIETMRNQIINEVCFSFETNSITVCNEEHQKLMRIIRHIDWYYYIVKFSLTGDSYIIKNYKEMLEFAFAHISDANIIKNFIYSQSKLKKYLNAHQEKQNKVDLAKILLTSMAELTDTYALKLINLYREVYKK
jgi:predicted deoxyguanosinetriphosphate triphosphohydrolase